MDSKDNIYTDPGLLRKHSELISVTTDKYNYPGVRIFYREHPKASVLPPKLPLLVFIHGRCLESALHHARWALRVEADSVIQGSGVNCLNSDTCSSTLYVLTSYHRPTVPIIPCQMAANCRSSNVRYTYRIHSQSTFPAAAPIPSSPPRTGMHTLHRR